MNKIDEFKEFVKNNPSLIKYVKNKDKSWQQFYEIYDMYGDSKEVWKEYLEEEKAVNSLKVSDILNWIKNVDIDKMQESISSIQRVLGVLEDLGNNNDKADYKPRPLYKHFED